MYCDGYVPGWIDNYEIFKEKCMMNIWQSFKFSLCFIDLISVLALFFFDLIIECHQLDNTRIRIFPFAALNFTDIKHNDPWTDGEEIRIRLRNTALY